jgi:hypothetical protein
MRFSEIAAAALALEPRKTQRSGWFRPQACGKKYLKRCQVESELTMAAASWGEIVRRR